MWNCPARVQEGSNVKGGKANLVIRFVTQLMTVKSSTEKRENEGPQEAPSLGREEGLL